MLIPIFVGVCLVPYQDPDPPPDTPRGPPPRILVARVVGEEIQATIVQTRYVPQTVTQEVNVGGMVQKQTVTRLVPISETRMQIVSLKGATFQQADNKKISLEELKKRLVKPGPVVIVDGDRIESGYRKLFKDSTLIVLVPSPTTPVPVPPRK